MIGLLFNLMGGPIIIAVILGCCMCFVWWRCRNTRIFKRVWRLFDGGSYDDSWLSIVVHEVKTEVQDPIKVSCRCGSNEVETKHIQPTSKGVFQEGLVLLIPDGSDEVIFELFADREAIARLTLSFAKHIVQNTIVERTLKMKSRARGIENVTITLTLVPTVEEDGVDPENPPDVLDVQWLVKRQMEKLKDEIAAEEHVSSDTLSDTHIYLKVTHGPLDLIEGMGNRRHCYFAILGPPESQRWIMGIWFDRSAWEASQQPDIPIDLMKVQSIMADPDEVNTFAIKYYDERRFLSEYRFRRIDRSRDVWVESLQKIIHAVREQRKEEKAQGKKRSTRDSESGAAASSPSGATYSKQQPQPAATASWQGTSSIAARAASSSSTLKKTSSKK